VLAVVAADRDDLPGARQRGEEVRLLEGVGSGATGDAGDEEEMFVADAAAAAGR
jgi:hypothetical protein